MKRSHQIRPLGRGDLLAVGVALAAMTAPKAKRRCKRTARKKRARK